MTEPSEARHTPVPWMKGTYVPTDEFKTIKEHECICRADGSLVAVFGPKGDRQSIIDRDAVGVAMNSYEEDRALLRGLVENLKKIRNEASGAYSEMCDQTSDGRIARRAFDNIAKLVDRQISLAEKRLKEE